MGTLHTLPIGQRHLCRRHSGCGVLTHLFQGLPHPRRADHIDPDTPWQLQGGGSREAVLSGAKSLADAVDEFERDIISEALEQTYFNQTRAADLLGTTRRILKYRMDKLGIDCPDTAR